MPSRLIDRQSFESMRAALLLLLSAALLPAADFPIARIITTPDATYADNARSWQGIPGIERSPNGRLWSTWFSGDTGEGKIGNYALAATTSDDGKTWSPPLVIQGPPGTRLGDPIPWLDPKGRLWIFYSQFTSKTVTDDHRERRATFAIRSDNPDSARPKWSAPILIAEGGILFGKPLVRPDGAWLAPFFVNGKPPWLAATNGHETGTLRSTDEGATWKWRGGTTIPKPIRNFSEATLAPRQDGSILMLIRTQAGLHTATSSDDGLTWTDPTPLPGFPPVVTRACLRRLASGAFILIYHDSPKGRERLTVWLSDDEGRTWPHKLTLDDRERVSYPDSTQSPDSRVFIAYDYGRYQTGQKQILLTILRESDIRAGQLPPTTKLVVNQCTATGNDVDLKAAQPPPK